MTNDYNVFVNAAFKYKELSLVEIDAIRDLYKRKGQNEIYEFSRNKKILPFASVLLSKLDIDRQFWDESALEYKKRNEGVIECLNSAFNKLSEHGVKKIFVSENFGALLLADSNKALFASGDVDIYADISQKEEIYKSFKELGYKIKERYTKNKLINSSFYNDDLLPEGFYFSICWNPLCRIKLPCFVNADEIVEWEKLINYKNTAIKLPDIESAMYICLMHISLHSFSRAPDIRLYIDINNISRLPVNWLKIMEFAKRDKTMVRLLTACILSKKLLDVDIPYTVLDYRRQYDNQVSNILNIVYDEKNNVLIYEPQGIKVLFIEAYSNDTGFMNGIRKILMPDRNWIKEVYCKDKVNIIFGYIEHIKNIL